MFGEGLDASLQQQAKRTAIGKDDISDGFRDGQNGDNTTVRV